MRNREVPHYIQKCKLQINGIKCMCFSHDIIIVMNGRHFYEQA